MTELTRQILVLNIECLVYFTVMLLMFIIVLARLEKGIKKEEASRRNLTELAPPFVRNEEGASLT